MFIVPNSTYIHAYMYMRETETNLCVLHTLITRIKKLQEKFKNIIIKEDLLNAITEKKALPIQKARIIYYILEGFWNTEFIVMKR